jgi:flagellar motility protein MotE (MotC chaperone)
VFSPPTTIVVPPSPPLYVHPLPVICDAGYHAQCRREYTSEKTAAQKATADAQALVDKLEDLYVTSSHKTRRVVLEDLKDARDELEKTKTAEEKLKKRWKVWSSSRCPCPYF